MNILPHRTPRDHAPRRRASVALVAMAMIAAACGESAGRSGATAPYSGSSSVQSAAASTFAVLGNAAATCTNGTILGDIGTFVAPPAGAVTLTSCPVSGTVHVGDAAAVQAYNDFLATYAALAPQTGDVCTTLTGTLAGVTLSPGSYCFDAAATLTGVLTLSGSANSTWDFTVGTSGTGALTTTNLTMVLANGARPCNVTWWVAQAVTLTTSAFVGNILAGAAITETGGTLYGDAWSKAGVTITGGAVTGCDGSIVNGNGRNKHKCNQGRGNGPEGCDPGDSNHHNTTRDETRRPAVAPIRH